MGTFSPRRGKLEPGLFRSYADKLRLKRALCAREKSATSNAANPCQLAELEGVGISAAMVDSPSSMVIDRLSRRVFLARGAAATLAAGGTSLVSTFDAPAAMPMPPSAGPADENLDSYIAAYMAAMNAPGLTLGLTDAGSTVRTAGYGFADVDRRIPVSSDHLFEIGSITKSFVALVILGLREEGKLDLQRPVLDYLPGLPIQCEFGAITVHHLLTHTSGLPDYQDVFQSDPAARLVQGFKPGEHFRYCNAGFSILGLLASKLDGRPWRKCVEARILAPLDMTQTVGVISTASRARSAVGYEPFWDDQVYPRQGRLAPAPSLVMDDTAGCIASTPGDMARYLRMLLNRGQGPRSRIVSEESFALMATPYIKAPDFSPTASYGYGIAVDTLEGHKILRHTGGMVAFASSIHVDLDGGVAAFASINAMQGYRPTAVTQYAVRLLRAGRESKPLPAPPAIPNPLEADDAADFAGTFTAVDGRKLVFVAEGKRLSLTDGEQSIPLQHGGDDSYFSTVPGRFADYSFEFGRKRSANATAQEADAAAKDAETKKAEVVEVSYGADWYVNTAYSGARTFTVEEDYARFAGRYRSDSAWGGDARVFILKDRLMVDSEPLNRVGGALFRVGDEPWMPDTAEFLHVLEGKARLLKLGGMDFRRVEVD
jgi:D-alanyl-D-alanine carboxypeptidase